MFRKGWNMPSPYSAKWNHPTKKGEASSTVLARRAKLQQTLKDTNRHNVPNHLADNQAAEGGHAIKGLQQQKYTTDDKGDWFVKFCYETLYSCIQNAIERASTGSLLPPEFYLADYKDGGFITFWGIILRKDFESNMPQAVRDLIHCWRDISDGLQSDLKASKEIMSDALQGNRIFKPKQRVAYLEKLWRLLEQTSILKHGRSVLNEIVRISRSRDQAWWAAHGYTPYQEILLNWTSSLLAIRNATSPLKKLLLKKRAFYKSTVCEVMTRLIFNQAIRQMEMDTYY